MSDEIRTIAVLGAGTMGRGIAQVAAQSGYTTRLFDALPAALDGAIERIRAGLDKAVDKGKLDAAVRERALASLSTAATAAEACAGADLVIEAVPERIELKREVLAAAVAAAPAAWIASNTSSLSIAEISRSLPDPSRVVGMHFFNPVPVMKLCEVVHHAGSAPAAVAAARAVAERMGKTAIVVKDAPGFASSRLGIALGMEAIRMVQEDVASPADIDTAMKLGYGHPMGPLELTDLVGLDVRLAIAEYLKGALGERFRPPALLEEMVKSGKLGAKSGEGFYRWKDGKRVD